jgi:hypothetical protein
MKPNGLALTGVPAVSVVSPAPGVAITPTYLRQTEMSSM